MEMLLVYAGPGVNTKGGLGILGAIIALILITQLYCHE